MKQKPEKTTRRTGNKKWKGIYGVDRKYSARVDRAKERGQYTCGPNHDPSSGPGSDQCMECYSYAFMEGTDWRELGGEGG